MFNKNLKGSEVCAIIEAGKLAKCAKIEYNGLIIHYTLEPDAVVPSAFTSPLEEQQPSPQALNDQQYDEAIAKQIKAASDLDTLMMTNPERYEALIAEEDINA